MDMGVMKFDAYAGELYMHKMSPAVLVATAGASGI